MPAQKPVDLSGPPRIPSTISYPLSFDVPPRSYVRRMIEPVFYPLLVLLHVIFTLSSLVLRVYELLTAAEPKETSTALGAPSISREGSSTRLDSDSIAGGAGVGQIRKSWVPPKHVAMVLLPPPSATMARANKNGNPKFRREVLDRAVESVLNMVEMAGEEGVQEISIYEATGMLELAKPEILAELVNDGDVDRIEATSKPSTAPSSPSPQRQPTEELVPQRDQSRSTGSSRLSDATLNNDDGVTTLVVYQSARFSSASAPSPIIPLTVHLLPPSASEIIPSITRAFIREGRSADKVNQDLISRRVLEALHFTRDPDLLIVHPLQTLSGWKSWLPRPAPELGGYPYWTLRITEIYQHPPPLPFIPTLSPLLHLAQQSSLPFFRKLGRLVPPSHVASNPTSAAGLRSEVVDLYRGKGRLGMDEWEGAMRAWGQVEQRLGR